MNKCVLELLDLLHYLLLSAHACTVMDIVIDSVDSTHPPPQLWYCFSTSNAAQAFTEIKATSSCRRGYKTCLRGHCNRDNSEIRGLY